MPLPVQSFDQIVNSQAAAMQANSTAQLDFTDGSVIKALIQANAANSIWLQALATTLLAVTRLSTSSGIDVDTFIADFGYSRFPGNPASGTVTFSRFTTTVQGVVPVGTIISDSQNGLIFTVTQDGSNPNFDPTTNSYIVAISTASMNVPCQCTVNGVIGNVIIGGIDTINSPQNTPGIDTVTNAAAFTNGQDPWSDTFTKQQFALYIQGLSRATYQAIANDVGAVNIGTEKVVRYNIVENFNEAGSPQLGYFYVVVDNGTGTAPSNGLIAAVAAAVEQQRGLTIKYSIDKTGFITVAIVVWVHLVSAPTETQTQITANITSALQAYAASIPFNQPFLYSKIAETVYLSDVNIASIPSSNAPTVNFNSSGASNVDGVGNNTHIFGIPTVTVNYI